jgi:hypothetical protein
LKATVPVGIAEPELAGPATVASNSTGSPFVEIVAEFVSVSVLGRAATAIDTGEDVDALKEVLPEYAAERLCVPTANEAAVHCACPNALNSLDPMLVAPS